MITGYGQAPLNLMSSEKREAPFPLDKECQSCSRMRRFKSMLIIRVLDCRFFFFFGIPYTFLYVLWWITTKCHSMLLSYCCYEWEEIIIWGLEVGCFLFLSCVLF